MRLRYKIVSVGVLLAGVFLWGRCSKTNAPPSPAPATVLPKDETQRIIVDPGSHTIKIETRTGTKTETLPDRPSIFDVKTNGTVKVTSSQLGFEVRPFIGLGFGSGLRGYAGADLWYFKRFNAGLMGVSPKLSNGDWADFRIAVCASYNFYNNTSVTLGYDNQKTIHALVSVRI